MNRQLNNIKYSNRSENTINFFIIPIGIEIKNNENIFSHANYLIFDFNNMEVERFEPHGMDMPHGMNYNYKLLDNVLEEKINSYNLNFKYIPPSNFLPKIGFQIKEISELNNDYIGDPNGYCSMWCIWWVYMRLSNPEINRIDLVTMLTTELVNDKYSYKQLIRNFSFYVTEIRDNLLKKANTNINEWINDTISENNINILNNVIIKEITNLY
jgi:hypothetical protein